MAFKMTGSPMHKGTKAHKDALSAFNRVDEPAPTRAEPTVEPISQRDIDREKHLESMRSKYKATPPAKERGETIAYGVPKSDSIKVNEHNEAISQKLIEAQEAYYEKHGSSSGGTDEEWNAQQALLRQIRSEYIKE